MEPPGDSRSFNRQGGTACATGTGRRCRRLAAEPGDERFLVGGFDRLRTVVGAEPGDRTGGGITGEDGEPGPRCTGAPGGTEIRPVEMSVGPCRLPLAVEI